MKPPKTADTRHLERRHLTWFATVYVPRPLIPILGKKLSKSLETHDLAEAQRRRHKAVAEFQDRIEAAAKGQAQGVSGGLLAEALADRERLAVSEDAAYDWTDRADQIEAEHGLAAAEAYARVASGKHTPVGHHVAGWLGEAAYPARSMVQHKGTVADLARWCEGAGVSPDIEAVIQPVAGRFIAGLFAANAARATINRKLSTLRAYWRWMKDRGHTKGDPWAGQRVTRARLGPTEDDKVRPFAAAEMRLLLSGKADAVLADFIRVASLTGARIESIAKLQVRDCQGGIFSIRRDKSKAGTRRVPIHSDLVAIIARRCEGKAAGDWVFHECSTTGTGSRSAAISKRFITYRRGLGIAEKVEGKRGSLVNFHSFRKFFTTEAIRAGQPEHIVQQVIGHKLQGITMGVYHGGDTMDSLRACVEAVRLPSPVVGAAGAA